MRSSTCSHSTAVLLAVRSSKKVSAEGKGFTVTGTIAYRPDSCARVDRIKVQSRACSFERCLYEVVISQAIPVLLANLNERVATVSSRWRVVLRIGLCFRRSTTFGGVRRYTSFGKVVIATLLLVSGVLSYLFAVVTMQ